MVRRNRRGRRVIRPISGDTAAPDMAIAPGAVIVRSHIVSELRISS